MAYDEALAERVRYVLAVRADVIELKMFGGLAFMVRGHMTCGIMRDGLMLRLGPEGAQTALARAHVHPMEFTGRPMKGIVLVGADGLRGKALRNWVEKALAYTESLPPKAAKRQRSVAGAKPAGSMPVRGNTQRT